MKSWSIQSTEAFATLNRDGVLYCDSPRTALYLDEPDNDIFSRSYAWMTVQMEKRMRVPRPEPANYPLWVWVQVGSYRKEFHPSSDEYEHGKSVLLTLDVPEDEILLSDFDIWHCVLNEFSTGTDRMMERRLNRFLDENGVHTKLKDYPPELREYVVSSWERVFDLDRRDRDFPTMRRNRNIQGTMWQIRSEWVSGYRML